ncbi:hypothetical protein BAU08_06480 [Bordetella bronchialis]|uniref:Uncharacterized protein n=1 Tax=Bordetella bronchialis TaxID=463025 RepID=A0A193FDU3_9BORD|nr:hypothetical protein BAU06_06220 [Bordetella bronchialis]ANN71026.1 hypothetical protein BAU08_06480 [Bordetella bronchialis]
MAGMPPANGYKDEIPAGAVDLVASIACDPMAGPHDTSKLFDIDMQKLARRIVLIANHGFGRLQIGQVRQPRASEHPTNRAGRHAQRLGDTGLGQTFATQLDDRQRLGRCNCPGRDSRPRRCIGQSRLAKRQEPP